MVVTHTHAKDQGSRSVGSKDRLDSDRRTRPILLPRDAVLARYLLSSCVCLSAVRPSQAGILSMRLDVRANDRTYFWHGGSFHLFSLCCEEIQVSPSGTLPQTLDLENFATASRWCYQQNSIVDGRACGSHLRRSTRRGWAHIVYYTSVDCNPSTPLLRFGVDLLYNLFLQLRSSCQDFD